jgi:hypothetical protein
VADPIIKCQSCDTEHTPQEVLTNRQCKNCGHPEFGSYRREGEDEICDFCSTPKPTLVYPAADFRMEVGGSAPDWGSMGWWACCKECHYLIEKGDREALAKRSLDTMPNRDEALAALGGEERVLALIREMHDNFWSHRQGAPFENLEVPDVNC